MSGGDVYRRLFGEVAVEKGFISSIEVDEALAVQRERREAGKTNKLLGQILIELGHMTPGQVQEVVEVLYPSSDDPESENRPENQNQG